MLVPSVVDHLHPLALKRRVLSTLDAHGLYERVGFVPLPESQKWMLLAPVAP